MRLENKVVVITGGNSGVGEATAKLFAKEGAAVVISARRVEALQKVENEIKEMGGKVLSVPTDISSNEACEKLIETAVKEFGKVDVLPHEIAPIHVIELIDEEETQVVNKRWLW